MAVVVLREPSTLKIRFNHGADTHGKAIIKTRSYANVKPIASNDAIYAVATAISSLQEHDMYEVSKVDNTTLAE
ncbi:DUF1659 domain-containing protein [Romboutsia weinsteinii]|uniref:DUF1659 domain-containing protein n=1 Tax=Romboutsia weinsteinii TaxID=2020949 RepID=A0A371J328_9FIRM|nr:DUF1659 domain-containing protein [Romboutsia weinsteinii]RDY27066.1 DUF1659 domain-containing protein [Romboutsia weinsteinii]